MLWNIQLVKLRNNLGALCLALFVLTVSASAQTPVKVKINIKNGTLLVDAHTKAPKPDLRMNPDPAFLELSFPRAVLEDGPMTEAIDKGLIQKIVTSQSNNDVLVRVYVLSKPKTSFSQTDTGYRYNLNLNEMASSQPSTSSAPAQPAPEPATKPVATQPQPVTQIPEKPVETKPATTKPVVTQPTTTKPATTKPVATQPTTTKPATTKPVATQPTTTKSVVTEPVATKPVTAQPTRTVTAPATQPTRTVTAPVAAASSATVREYYPFKNKSAESWMKAAQLAFPDISYLVDPVLNVLIVEGTPQDIQQLEKFLRAQSPK